MHFPQFQTEIEKYFFSNLWNLVVNCKRKEDIQYIVNIPDMLPYVSLSMPLVPFPTRKIFENASIVQK